MKKIVTGSLFLFLFQVIIAQYNIKDFGAKGDGINLDTRSIQRAIDKAYQNKGGIVNIPSGTYKIGTLILKDNVELHLQHGATLLGSPDYKDYAIVNQQMSSRTKDLYAKYFMIFAEGATNIAITGSGVIYGNGLKHFQEERPQNLRPYMLRLVSCRNVTIKDVQLLESANWTCHLLNCKDVNIGGVVMENRGEGNRDGLDIDACERVTVANSRFSTTDDAIVMKATNDTLCRDITITNCLFREIGGSAIKTGTESNGGFKNINVSNCVIKNIDQHAGIELMTVDGGMMQQILFENITMDKVATPFFIRLGIRSRPYKTGQYVNKIDEVRDIQLNNITVDNAKLPSSIIGLHSKKISNITISNYTVRHAAAQNATPYNKVPFLEFDYPAAVMFENLPAYGLYCRSVEGIHLQNIKMYSAKNEKRPALVFDKVNNVELFSVKAEADPAAPMMHFRNTTKVTAAYCSSLNANNALFEVEKNADELNLSNNILLAGQKEIIKTDAIPDEQAFEDFKTEIKYSVDKGEKINGLYAYDLKTAPLKINMNTKKGALQLCLLVLNDSQKPGKVLIKYDGIQQEFLVSWNEWGWAPVSLLKEYNKNEKIEFEISPADPNTHLKISKLYLRYQDIGFTD